MRSIPILWLVAALSVCPIVRGEDRAAVENSIDNGWDRHLFDYVPPKTLIVEEQTPTRAQTNFFLRPPQVETRDAAEPKTTGPAEPLVMGEANVVHLRFRDALGDIVPALLCTPRNRAGPFPLVIAVHGLATNKAEVCAQIGPALLKRGYAVLAGDLPCHGERPGNPFSMVGSGLVPGQGFPLYQTAVIDVRQLIDLASQRKDLDTRGGVTLVGYSLGSWVSSIAGPADNRVKAMVLMVGGALDVDADLLKLPKVAATDPRLALAHFAGRPLLLLNGKNDPIVHPDWSRRLFAAAPEPKKQVWYDCGHILTPQAYEDAAEWIAQTTGIAKRKAD